jgi:fatty acid desaturase
MANMTVNQRTQYERQDLSAPTTGTQVRNRRRLIIFNVIALAIFGALAYAAAVAIDGWAKGVVLGVIVLTTIGAMIALSPNRRA